MNPAILSMLDRYKCVTAQDYENALKINPQDTDAKFNHDFVKKKLEELKQQQQQSNKDKNDKNQDQNNEY